LGIFSSIAYTLSVTFTKMSILCLYLRIFTYDLIKRLTKILLAVVIVSHSWILASVLTSCVPLASLWDINVKPTYCHPAMVFWSNGAIHMTTDFLIFLLPLPIVLRMRIKPRRKIALLAVFLLGFA
jgi:hypothetical protein